MTSRDVAEALALATERLVSASEVADDLLELLDDCQAVLGADAVGLLVSDSGGLELIGSTSHHAAELELYQLQHDDGPCVEAIRTRRTVTAAGPELGSRWSPVGTAILAAGFTEVQALPLRWHDQVLGALNVFYGTTAPEPTALADAQRFADMATATLTQSHDTALDAIQTRIAAALGARAMIEQAKGVLAYDQGLEMPAAYAHLVRVAHERGVPLSRHAADVVAAVSRQDR